MLATPGPLPIGPEWCYEVKWDGMRLLADVTADRLRLTSRTGRDMTAHFPELAELATVAPDALLDGEVVLLTGGAPSFTALADRFHRVPTAAEVAARPAVYMAFDLLRLYGVSLLDRPLEERRATLERLELAELARVRLSPVYDDGAALLTATVEQGLEGVVAKRRDSVYRDGQRSRSWIKVAHRRTQDCLVGGWRPERTHPSRIGGLLLGVPDADGSLLFAGRVGSGVGGDATQRALREQLEGLALEQPPFAEELPRLDAAGARWCEPRLVVEVSHTGWTEGHRLRHPVLRGLRPDVDPGTVTRT
ncbi:non-homologous end-joining DNA ligase [Pseudonocardia acaciae]|uniref:non-homologous end-joining DNA ligase n=1 Tax=Pseudonocardia acaciae TaxID=551276 RepID=UPI0006841E45|nr:non-homologous end-joining DNA ligase [Pseudonocardia acaciae]